MSIERQALHHQGQYSSEQRKLLGVHYTPEVIIEYIIRRTLQPYLENGDLETIRHITLVDPACGSGLFLLKAFDLLGSFWSRHVGRFGAGEARYVLENNLYGVDIDASAVRAARDHLLRKAQEFGVETVDLDRTIRQGDALMRSAAHLQMEMLWNEVKEAGDFRWPQAFPQVFARGGFDCVVSNPPFIRIQHVPMERRARYVELYETARGRFDASGLFVELAYSLARPGGRIGYIVSNKLLSTNGASPFRDYLRTHYTVAEIVDLADTKLFSAAVLPMILILGKTPPASRSFVYASIREVKTTPQTPVPVEHVLSFLEQASLPLRTDVEWQGRHFRVEKFEAPLPTSHQRIWTFHYPTERSLIEKLRAKSVCTLGSLARKISVGLKTTADNVFIKPMTLDFIERLGLEQELVFPLLESHNVHRWRCDWRPGRDFYVLYPHREQGGRIVPVELERYPHAERYLRSHRQQLEARTYLRESGRKWYEIWVHQSPRDFGPLKIVTPDIASGNRFALDDRKLFVNGTCFYVLLKDPSLEHHLFILALLNSRALEYFHKVSSGNVLYAQRFRYWTSYLTPYPIPAVTDPRNSAAVKRLIENTRVFVQTTDEQEIAALEEENDRLVYQLFELTDREIEELESSLALYRETIAGSCP